MGVFHSTSPSKEEKEVVIRKKCASDRKSRPNIKFLDLLSNVARIQVDNDIGSIINFIGYPNEIEFSRDISFPDNKHLPLTQDAICVISSTREYYEFTVSLKLLDGQKKLLVDINNNFEHDNHPNIFLKKVKYIVFFFKNYPILMCMYVCVHT